MNREDIIRMAREAGLHRQQHNLMSNPVQYRFSYDGYEENLERFAALVAQRVLAGSYPEMVALVAAAEREACAYRAGIALLGSDRGLANRVDQAIRARGETK